jgi:hypothetical protein
MLHNRNIRLSVREHFKDALENPGVGGPGAYNVYGENNLPQRNPSFEPQFPYVFLIDSNIEPTKADLPLVLVEINPITRGTVELGLQARTADLNLHIYGRTRGERDDLASYFQDWMTTSGSGHTLSIKDYTAGAGQPVVDTGKFGPVAVWSQLPVPEWQREEASLTNHNIVSTEIRFKTL